MFPAGLDLRSGGGVVMSDHPAVAVYGGGTLRRGVFAAAKVTIDGISTRHDVRIALIEKVGCSTDRPGCGPDDVNPRNGIYGVLGVSLRAAPDGLENPLLELPAPYASGWSISFGGPSAGLTLGAQPPNQPSAAIPLPSDGGSSVRGFDDAAGRLCWRFQATKRCLPTMFDTGSSATFWFAPSPRERSRQSLVPAGSVVSASTTRASSLPFWSFIAGGGLSRSAVFREPTDPLAHPFGVAPGSGPGSFVDAGIEAFYAFTITYDSVHGRVYLTPSKATLSGRVTVPASLFAANSICMQASQRQSRAEAALRRPNPHNLESLERYAAVSERTWAKLSLDLDKRLAQLQLPPTEKSLMARAVAADQAGSTMQIAVARTLTSYRTRKLFDQAAARFASRYYALEDGWMRNMDLLGIGGCAV